MNVKQVTGLVLIVFGLLLVGDIISLEVFSYSGTKPVIVDETAAVMTPSWTEKTDDMKYQFAFQRDSENTLQFQDPKESFTVVCWVADDQDVKVCEVWFNYYVIPLEKKATIERQGYVLVQFVKHLTFSEIKGHGNPEIDYDVPIRVRFVAYDSLDKNSESASVPWDFKVTFKPYDAMNLEGGEEGNGNGYDGTEPPEGDKTFQYVLGYACVSLGAVMVILGKKR